MSDLSTPRVFAISARVATIGILFALTGLVSTIGSSGALTLLKPPKTLLPKGSSASSITWAPDGAVTGQVAGRSVNAHVLLPDGDAGDELAVVAGRLGGVPFSVTVVEAPGPKAIVNGTFNGQKLRASVVETGGVSRLNIGGYARYSVTGTIGSLGIQGSLVPRLNSDVSYKNGLSEYSFAGSIGGLKLTGTVSGILPKFGGDFYGFSSRETGR